MVEDKSKEYTLTIAIITMNRAQQLKEAINSCLKCTLPPQTEFVIVDNGSIDETESVVNDFKNHFHEISFVYEKQNHNIGAGPGRNRAFELSRSKYVYFLDDDAFISSNSQPYFFTTAIEIMETNLCYASLSTYIYDNICGDIRNPKQLIADRQRIEDIVEFRGGSHFLRKSVFELPLYLNIRYGYEELSPSFYAYEKGLKNVCCGQIEVVHNPMVDKWKITSDIKNKTLVRDIGNQYAIKKLHYPTLFFPFLRLSAEIRSWMYLRHIENGRKMAFDEAEKIIAENPKVFKLSIRTIWKMFLKFGFTVF